MKYVEVVAEAGSLDTVAAIADKVKARDFRPGAVGEDGMQTLRLVVTDDRLQATLDALQNVLGAQPTARILVLAVEASLPRPEGEQEAQEDTATAAREALVEGVRKGAYLTSTFLVLVALSTVVAAIGLVEDNVAVVIGAMVIAPLLGPNLALSLGTALGDLELVRTSARTLFVGIVLAVALSAVLGALWPMPLDSPELVARGGAGLDSVALALASGAAAALSLTTGLSSVLVGVMVAVALLPPAAALGLFLGDGSPVPAAGAGLLLAINVVCVNLASKVVFALRGVRPRTGLERAKARRALVVYILGWLVALAALLAAVYAHRSLIG
jgi:uncharacterized hydrophobic protein (TIGR00341 family)